MDQPTYPVVPLCGEDAGQAAGELMWRLQGGHMLADHLETLCHAIKRQVLRVARIPARMLREARSVNALGQGEHEEADRKAIGERELSMPCPVAYRCRKAAHLYRKASSLFWYALVLEAVPELWVFIEAKARLRVSISS